MKLNTLRLKHSVTGCLSLSLLFSCIIMFLSLQLLMHLRATELLRNSYSTIVEDVQQQDPRSHPAAAGHISALKSRGSSSGMNATKPPLHTVATTVLPKVALLFLAPMGPHNDAVWLKFLKDAADLPPPALASHNSFLARSLRHGPGFDLNRLVGNPHPPWTSPPQSTPSPLAHSGLPLSHPPSQSANASGAAAAAPQSANASGAAAAQGEEQEQLPYPLQDPQDSASCLNAGKKGVFKMLHWVKEQIKGLWWAFFWLFETDPLKPGAPPAVWEALHVQREARQLREAVASGVGHLAYKAQKLFSVYVLTHQGYSRPSSVFAGREVSKAISLDLTHAYGQPTLMHASRLLLATALRDPANVRFVLLSDTSIPVVHPALVWAQLLSEHKSRLDACFDTDMDSHRRSPDLHSDHLKPEHWRKSSQWWTLTRAHAALAAADQHVAPLFSAFCRSPELIRPTPRCNTTALRQHDQSSDEAQNGHSGTSTRGAAAVTAPPPPSSLPPPSPPPPPVCIADEHYMPTLLASYGLDLQTDCNGVAHFADWVTQPGSSHPRSFTPSDLTPKLVKRLHTEHDAAGHTKGQPLCSWETAESSLAYLFGNKASPADDSTAEQEQAASGDEPDDGDVDRGVALWVLRMGYRPVSTRCSVFARKFPPTNDSAKVGGVQPPSLGLAHLQAGHLQAVKKAPGQTEKAGHLQAARKVPDQTEKTWEGVEAVEQGSHGKRQAEGEGQDDDSGGGAGVSSDALMSSRGRGPHFGIGRSQQQKQQQLNHGLSDDALLQWMLSCASGLGMGKHCERSLRYG